MKTKSLRFIMCSLVTTMFAICGSSQLLYATPSHNQEKYIKKVSHTHKHSHKKGRSKNKSGLKVMKKETNPMKGITFGWIPIPNSSRSVETVGEQPSYSYKVTRIKPKVVQVKLRFTKITHYPKVFTSLETRASNLQSYFCKDSNPPIVRTVSVDASRKEVTLELTSDRNVDRYFPLIGGYTFQDTWLHFVAYDEHESTRAVSALASHLQ